MSSAQKLAQLNAYLLMLADGTSAADPGLVEDEVSVADHPVMVMVVRATMAHATGADAMRIAVKATPDRTGTLRLGKIFNLFLYFTFLLGSWSSPVRMCAENDDTFTPCRSPVQIREGPFFLWVLGKEVDFNWEETDTDDVD